MEMEKDGRKMETNGGFSGNFFEALPEGFVANVLALTSPRDVCRLSLVGSVFRSAAEWDAVWEKFLPPDYQKFLAEAVGGDGDGAGGSVRLGSKKEMYLRLCDHPVIIDGGNKSFSLDKLSTKKCYMLGARDLLIIWGDTPRYWRWISVPDSRFAEVAELVSVCWLEVRGRISTSLLSNNTCYVAYLVYKWSLYGYGLENRPVEVCVGMSGNEGEAKQVFLDPDMPRRQEYVSALPARRRMGMFNRIRQVGHDAISTEPFDCPKRRQDGWLEVEMGEYFNAEGGDGELEMSVMEVKGGDWKGGIIVQGIEIRPKRC